MLRPIATFLLALAAAGTPLAQTALAQTIYPLDRAEILSGARFDFKVEFPDSPVQSTVAITVNGKPVSEALKGEAQYLAKEEGQSHAAFWIRDTTLDVPGTYRIEARNGDAVKAVTWEVYATPAAKARNVILFIGDGMSNAHRVAARMLSKGIAQGRYGGELAIDDMPHMALVSTAGTDSIITDSANSMSAYTTGHKSCVNALGVYCAHNKSNEGHPKVETIGTLARRVAGKAVGIVTNTEIEDATPAGVIAHTRRRADFDRIVEMFFSAKPEVMLGGGSANFLPKPVGKRSDNKNFLKDFEAAGYKLASTATEMTALAADARTTHLLGLFNAGNMDGALDRRILKKGTVAKFPDQPDLVDELSAALTVLARNDKGFFLAVESGMLDKYTHALDWERAVYDTIMLDNAVAKAKAWAAPRGDTLIIVVADHTHPVSIIGTYDDARKGDALRDKLGVYADAGFPNYPAPGTDGYPSGIDVSKRIAFSFSAYPDHCESGKPHLDNPNAPTQAGAAPKTFVANEANCKAAGSARRQGNLPAASNSGVHSGEDVVLTATGPGSEAFHGRIDNTRVFRAITTALGLGQAK